MIGMRRTVFYCDWYDNTVEHEVILDCYPRGQVQRVSNPLQPNSSSHISPTDDLAAVKLVVDLTGFGLGDVVHSESKAEIG
ncbi:hypothetical protein F2Q69_00036691 [Brassica cretica]|uniref:Uncharacterized protein n=1 Tax=Brassica cretica TaxID=69181 RepID=A0A8S9SCC5_BRACR|nr:hypothetical protein F2Q69_00036691 [Brassica cretica]